MWQSLKAWMRTAVTRFGDLVSRWRQLPCIDRLRDGLFFGLGFVPGALLGMFIVVLCTTWTGVLMLAGTVAVLWAGSELALWHVQHAVVEPLETIRMSQDA